MLSSAPSAAWLKEVEDYEARMFDYFSECSIKLREWYNKGGDDSDAYRLEYNRLSDEYQSYVTYIQQLRNFVNKSTESFPKDQPKVDSPNHVASFPAGFLSESQMSYSTATAAVCYTKYYQEMISYFDKLLTSLEGVENERTSSDTNEQLAEVEPEVTEDAENEVELDVADDSDEPADVCCNPHAVMEQYFDQFGETGKWDWASWNNYLSWIARTNPQWYGIFLEYSQSLGIDWDQMYSSWKASDPISKLAFDDLIGPVDPSFIKQPDLNKPIYHGLLFGSTIECDQEEEDDFDGLYCRTCSLQFQNERAFTLHLRGVTHIQRALEGLKRRNPQHIDRFPLQGTQPDVGGARHHAWLQSQYMEQSKSNFVHPGSLYCELCQVQSSSHVSLQSHLSGRRHKDNVTIFRSTGDPSTLKDKRPAHGKTVARLQTLLDVCTQPLIGLNYIVERQFGDDEECAYFCDLCNERLTRQDAIKHACDVPHRCNYMKSHYPDMCAIVASDCSSPLVRLKRIDFFARKIEDFEGRKRVKVKQLSAFDALRRIWRPLEYLEAQPSRFTRKQKKPLLVSCSNAKATKTATIKKRTRKIQPKVPSDDLEEGEITEDSSEDDEDHPTVDETCKDKNEVASSLNGETDNVATEGSSRSVVQSALLSMENFLPKAVANFRSSSDCEAYIDTLRHSGSLTLGTTAEVIKPSEASDAASHPPLETTWNEEFEREAQWVLDRVHARQEAEEENRKQLASSISAASKMSTSNSSAQERQLRIHRGLCVMEESWRSLESGLPAPIVGNGPQTDLLLPNLDTEVGPEPASSELLNNGLVPSRSTSVEPTNLGLLGPMDPNRQRLAVSNGAVEIILSALGALRDAGQLPDGFMHTLQNPSTSVSSGDPVTEPAEVTKTEVRIPDTSDHLPVNGTPIPKPVVEKTPLLATPTEAKQLPSPTVPPVQVTANPRMGLLTSQTVGLLPSTTSALFSTVTHPSSASLINTSSIPPLMGSLLDIQPKRSVIGLLGDPQPSHPPISVPMLPLISSSERETPRPVPAPVPMIKKDTARSSPKPSPKIPVKQARFDTEPEPQPPVTDALPPPLKVPPARPELNGSETMFDAYALYSRRLAERNRSRPPPRSSRFDSAKAADYRTSRNASAKPSAPGTPGGGVRKLSMIADLLGVNEPPPAPPSISVATDTSSSDTVPSVSTVSDLDYRCPGNEPSYLIPVSTFSLASPNLPRISYYIPKNHSQTRSTMVTPSSLPHPIIPSGPFVPLLPPVAHPPFLTTPINVDEFSRRMQST